MYGGVIEHSIYIHLDAARQGVGRRWLSEFLDRTYQAGVWMVQSSVFPENIASLKLPADAGLRPVGCRERIALMTHGPIAGQWRDTVLLERRMN